MDNKKSLRLVINNELEGKGAEWMVSNMEFNTSLSSILAYNAVLNATAVLRDRPDLHRHDVKRRIKCAVNECESYYKNLLSYMRNADIIDRYTDSIVDVTNDDVTKMRQCIERRYVELKGVSAEDAMVYSWVDTARILMYVSMIHMQGIIEAAIKQYDRDFTPEFAQFSIAKPMQAWMKVCDALRLNLEIASDDAVMTAVHTVASSFRNGDYLKACVENMHGEGVFGTINFVKY